MIIKATVDRIEGDKAVLKGDDGVSVVWPKDRLPDKVHEGKVLIFEILSDEEMEAKEKKTAKDILNELLNSDS